MYVLRKFLYPISFLYSLVVQLRNWCYDFGIFKSRRFNTKTICIGNISVGGTGKTPMVETVIRLLSPQRKIAVLSRGYKRKSKGFTLGDTTMEVAMLGDEPYQILSKFPQISIAVDTDRCNGIEQLEKLVAPEIILLDDAMQHRRVTPNITVLLTTYSNLYTDDCYLPSGTLRDSKSCAERATVIVVTKCPINLSEENKTDLKKKLHPTDRQLLLFATIGYTSFLDSQAKLIDLAYFKNKSITLVTGIANPKPLVGYLEKNGLTFEHLKYKDHHFFTEKDIQILNKKSIVLTTEKDYTKLRGRVESIYYIPIEHEFLDDGLALLQNCLNSLVR